MKATDQEDPKDTLIDKETTPSKHTSQHTFRHNSQMSSDMFRVRGYEAFNQFYSPY